MSQSLKRVVGISGSLRADSNNTKLIEVAKRCAPEDVEFHIASGLSELPHFNPDLNVEDFEPLVSWIDLVRQADGLILSSPEYARGYPGTLKNALDWLVQTDAHIDKPFMLLNASTRSTVARDSLIVVLETMSGIYEEDASLTIPMLGKSLSIDELLASEALVDQVRRSLTKFLTKI